MDFNGVIDNNGNIKLAHRDMLTAWAKNNTGKKIKLTVSTVRRKRSIPENNYYWGVIIPYMLEWFREAGYDYNEKDTHETLKAQFNTEVLVNDKTGEVLEIPKSTTRNTTVEMEEYMERIRRWAGEFCGVVIPLPNEELEIKFGEDRSFVHGNG